jgi:beta-1,4-mannosyl-glycoprotein beta-1,4-N-acetylglucosaminyltransferase
MKIVDCFIFYNELKLLQFRMNYLYDYVDHFILVESSLTHAGNPKPFYFEENKHLFQPYLDKIVHIKVTNDIDTQRQFKLSFRKSIADKKNKSEECIRRGNFQRNCIERGFKVLNLADEDIIISYDADEFIDRNTIARLRSNGLNGIYALDQDLYYYNLTCKSNFGWNLPNVMNYGSYKNFKNLAFIRANADKPPILEKSGWHFSYFGNVDFIIDKIKQSADQTFNTSEFLNRENILKKLKNGEDLFGRNYDNFRIIPIEQNTYLPDGYELLIELTK